MGREIEIPASKLRSAFSVLMRRTWRVALLCACSVVVLSVTAYAQNGSGRNAPGAEWMLDWEVKEGFALAIDTEGFHYPTSIAFVEEPGADPKDPLYFVTELEGALKVVTNDRTVYTFAEGFFENPAPGAMSEEFKTGMVGVTLAPEYGYVFVSYNHVDEQGILRNNIARFQSTPHTFGLKPDSMIYFTEVFGDYVSATEHQVSEMVVSGDHLYVSVGDAHRPFDGKRLDTILGKILRMTLDGKPVPGNPFYQNDDVKRPENYIWASGFRNPFGLGMVNGKLFTAENGLKIDRFTQVYAGRDYGWDGSDWSIGTNADLVFSPAVSPTHFVWLNQDNMLFPEQYRNKFYVALTGNLFPGSSDDHKGAKSVVTFDYDMEENRVASRPVHFLKYRGSGVQLPIDVDEGPDGLYVVPLMPMRDGTSGILKISFNPEVSAQIRTITTPRETAKALMLDKGCWGCHGFFESDLRVAPPLDIISFLPRLLQTLESSEYEASVRALDELDTEPFVSYREARQQVLDAKDVEKARLWIKYRLEEPRFDRQASLMPKFELTEEEIDIISNFLVDRNVGPIETSGLAGFKRKAANYVEKRLPNIRFRHLVIVFATGCVLGGVVILFSQFVIRKVRRRRTERI